MVSKRIISLSIILMFLSTMAMAQFDGGFGGGGGLPPMGGGMGPMEQNESQMSTSRNKKSISEGVDISMLNIINDEQTTKLVERLKKIIERHNKKILSKFDTNKNGQLDKDELKAWKKWLSEQTSENVSGANRFGGMAVPDSTSDQMRQFGPPDGGGMPNQEGGHGITALSATSVTDKTALKEKTLSSVQSNESVIRVQKGGDFSGEDLTLKKASGDTTSGDESNFYGLNAAFVAEAGATAHLTGGSITTNAEGANAVFAFGKGANITVNNICIDTQKNSSRGLDATYGGSITASDVTITTQGAHCAALATDRGEGTVKVNNCNATTHGAGSPGIYSTGAISAENSAFYATGSEAAVIEGKNSIALDNCTLTGMKNWGVMLYQSFSGDAGVGTSSIVMKNSKLLAAQGPLFYCTNTKTSIILDNDKLVSSTGILLRAEGNSRWGRKEKNGADVTFKSTNQSLSGIISVDSISSLKMDLGAATTYVGAINPNNQSQQVDLIIEKGSTVSLTADSYIRRLALVGMSNEEAKLCIQSNGYRLHIKETK